MIKKIILLIMMLFTITTYGKILDEFGDEIKLDIKREKHLTSPAFVNLYIDGEMALTKQNYLIIRLYKKLRRINGIDNIDAIKINGKQYRLYELYNNNSYCCYIVDLKGINTNQRIEYIILHDGLFLKGRIWKCKGEIKMEERIDYLYTQSIEEYEYLYYTEKLACYDNEDNIDYNYYY